MRIFVLTFLLLCFVLAPESHAQGDNTLSLFVAQTGTITPSQASASWSFSALANEVVSLHVQATSADFDPVLQVIDADGRAIISNDDYDYPTSRDALLEAITLPRTGVYQAVVSGFDDSTGNYQITLTPGYADITLQDTFDESSWQTTDDGVTVDVSDGGLSLSSEGVQISGLANNPSSPTLDNFYAQVNIVNVSGREGWTVGLALRVQSSGYYLLTINSRGTWQFSAVENNERRIIRDSTPHPAIVPGENTFTLGVLANQRGFDIFYNGQIVGQAIDDAMSGAGRINLYLETASAVGAQASATFDDLYATTPTIVNNSPVFPEQIILGTNAQIAQEFERRQVISPGGQLRFSVEQSFLDSSRPGVLLQPLASGSTFTTYILGTTVNIVQNTRPDVAGCGLVFRNVSDASYMVAYIDTVGGYGVAPRAGDQFQPGVFNQNPDLFNETNNALLVIVLDSRLYYYLNGRFVGTLNVTSQEGTVGNALINFEAVNTTCQFSNTWLWSLD